MPYNSPHSARLADLLIRRGQVAGDRARNSGNLWAGVAQGLGQIPAQIQQRKAAEAAAIQQAQDRDLTRRKTEAEIASSEALTAGRRDEQTRAKEARDLAAKVDKTEGWLTEVAASPELDVQRAAYRSGRSRLIQEGVITENDAPEFFPGMTWVKLKYAKEILPAKEKFAALFPEAQAPKTREIKTRNADGSETVQIVEDAPGFSATSAPPKPTDFEWVTRGGRPMQIPKGTAASGDVPYQPPSQAQGPQTPMAVIGPNGRPVFVHPRDAIGKTPAAGTQKAATGLEKRALNFFNRAQQADNDLEQLEDDVAKMNLGQQTYMQWAPNFMQTETGQLYTQAQRAFTEARLRKDSGAAIPEQEFANDRKTYFAQPGDSKETLDQKRRARGAVLASLGFESGQALGEFVGDADEARRIVDDYKARAARPGGVTITSIEEIP